MSKDLLKLAHISNKKTAKKIVFIIIVTITFVLVYIPFSLYKTYDEASNFLMNNSYSVKMIQIIREDQKEDVLKLNLQDEAHVVTIIKDMNEYYAAVYWPEQNKNLTLGIFQNIDSFVPSVIKGHSIINEDEIICPNRLAFGAYDDKYVEDLLDMEKYLNKEIEIKNYQKISKDEIKEYTYKVKIVGLFDPTLNYNYNGCYGSRDFVKKLYEDWKPYNYDDAYYKAMTIFVDDYRNVSKITNILNENKIDYSVPNIEIFFMDSIVNSVYILSVAFFIISTITLYIYVVNYIKSKRKNIALYRALGYSYSTIQFIIYYGVFELLLISYAISSFFVLAIKYVIQYFARKIVNFATFDIKISYLIMALFVVISLFITFIVSIRIVRNCMKEEIRDILA